MRAARTLIDDGTLGKLYYYDSTRVNLGLFQHDVNVLWDLAPHDLSIVDHLIGQRPEAGLDGGADALGGGIDRPLQFGGVGDGVGRGLQN